MDDLVADRTVIVTGAARGIGLNFAIALVEEGANVVLADLAEPDVVAAAASIEGRGSAVGIAFDQTSPESIQRMILEAEDSFGPIHCLVNNAALFSTLTRKPALEIEPEEWETVLRVNLTGPFLCSQAVLPGMIERSYGKIVNIVSASVFRATNQIAHYVSSKSGLVGLTRALAREYGASGIRVNALSPGSTDSGASISTRDVLENAAAHRSIPRVQVPSDLVGTLIFLCSSMSDFMTGQHLVVDGGSVFH